MNIDRFKSLIFEFRRQAGGEKFMTRNRANYIWDQIKKLDDIVVENFFKPYIQNAKQDPFASSLEGALKKLIDPSEPVITESLSPVEEIGYKKEEKQEFKPPNNAYVRERTECCDFGFINAKDKNGGLYLFVCNMCISGEKAKTAYASFPQWGPEYANSFTKV